MVSLSNNWTVTFNRKSGNWLLEHKTSKHAKRVERFAFSNRAALALADAIIAAQDEAPKKLNKLERNKPKRQRQARPENFSGCNGQEWLDRVRPDVIDFTHALILAKEAGLKIANVEGVALSPYEAGVEFAEYIFNQLIVEIYDDWNRDSSRCGFGRDHTFNEKLKKLDKVVEFLRNEARNDY